MKVISLTAYLAKHTNREMRMSVPDFEWYLSKHTPTRIVYDSEYEQSSQTLFSNWLFSFDEIYVSVTPGNNVITLVRDNERFFIRFVDSVTVRPNTESGTVVSVHCVNRYENNAAADFVLFLV